MTTIFVVGSSGRVGSAIVTHLTGHHDVRPIDRELEGTLVRLPEHAPSGTSVLVNAAGVAHVDSDDTSAPGRLREGNVELPMTLARAALDAHAGFLHISSSKAADPSDSPYAASKAQGEAALESEFEWRFIAAGLPMVILRPVALLFPPLGSGKIRYLRHLRHVPIQLVPPIPLPVLVPQRFLQILDQTIETMASQQFPNGLTRRDISPDEQGNLRDVARAFHRVPN